MWVLVYWYAFGTEGDTLGMLVYHIDCNTLIRLRFSLYMSKVKAAGGWEEGIVLLGNTLEGGYLPSNLEFP